MKICLTKSQLTDFFKEAVKPTDLVPAPIPKSTAQAKSIQRGVEQAIPEQILLKGEVVQELANSRIVSSLPPDKQIPVTKSIANEFAQYRKAQEGVRGAWTKIRETVQDSFIRAKQLIKSVSGGQPVPENIDIDQARVLFDGRVHTRLEDIREVAKGIDQDIVKTAKTLKTTSDELSREVDSFLHARHALERNAKLGDGAAGLTNKEAQEILEVYKKSINKADVDRIANQISELNSQTLKTLLDAEVIDQELFNLLTKTYKNHIPLQRVLSETDDIVQVLSGKGFDVKGTGIRKAVGSDKPVADILTNVVANLEQATIRAEKNLVDLTTLRFARANKELGIFEEIKPKAIGETFEKDGTRRIITERIDDPTVLVLREKGNPVFLRINDKRLAVALKGVNVEKVPSLLRGIAAFTRTYAGLHTRFNYEFAFSNTIRDIQEMAVYMASRKETGFGGASSALMKQPESIKAVFDFVRGADTEGARLYKQMRLDGGTTGGLGLSTRQQVNLDIESIRKLNRSKPRQAASKTIELVDKWNTIFEDSTRLSVYRAALDKGLSRGQAAKLAKEATINFNQKGTAGPLINGLYMFSNASIQGTTKMLVALKNPKVLGAVTASISVAIYSANEWNDSVDPDWRDKVTKWDRSSNLVIALPSEDEFNYITIPISWGLKPIKVALEYAYDASTGHGDLRDAVQGITTSVLESYNPLAGDENILNTLTPTILKVPMEISKNRAWYGNAIKPDYDPNVPASAKYFKSLENTLVGRTAIKATSKLSDATKGAIEISPADANYAFNQYIGGVGRSISKIINTVSSLSKGEDLDKKEIPVLSRFLKERDEEQVLQSLYFTEKERVDKEAARQKVQDVRRLTPIYEEAQMLLKEDREKEAQAIVDNLSDEDYEIYKKMRASDKRRQTSADQVKIFPVVKHVQDLLKSGENAEAQKIVDELTEDEWNDYQSVKKQLGLET